MQSFRKLGASLVLVAAIPFATVAKAEETGGGCGVGKLVMEGKSGKNAHIVVALINFAIEVAVGPIHILAMTTGTLGCDVSKTVSNDREKETFFASNQDNILVEIAQGQGVYLHSLASLMGVAEQDRTEFFVALQSNYDVISGSENAYTSVQSVMQANPRLAGYVS